MPAFPPFANRAASVQIGISEWSVVLAVIAANVVIDDRDLATQQVISGIEKLASDHGYIVLRVSPGGGEYRVVIVDDSSESHRVTKVFGPFPSR
ncbi:MAG: hypothetical protein WA117_16180 [Verrucomicrobiia bacterium]